MTKNPNLDQLKAEMEAANKKFWKSLRTRARDTAQKACLKTQDRLWRTLAKTYDATCGSLKTKDGVSVPKEFKPYYSEAKWGRCGFDKTTGIESIDGSIRIYWRCHRGKRCVSSTQYSGTTEFVADSKRFSFDRRGIDSSFSASTKLHLKSLLLEQIERAKRGIEKRKQPHTKIPGTPFERRAEQIEKMKESLKTVGQVRLTPRGMGTGCVISLFPPRDRWDGTQAPKELETLLGKSPLYIRTFDYD